MTMSDDEIAQILPSHLDFRRMRSAVAAFVTADREGMDLAMAEANSDGRSMNFITALMWQLVVAYDLHNTDNLAQWRQGILYHAQHEGESTHE